MSITCTVGKKQQQQQKKKTNTCIYFNANYCREIKFVPIIIDYCLHQFDDSKFFLEVRIHGESLPNYNFFTENN